MKTALPFMQMLVRFFMKRPFMTLFLLLGGCFALWGYFTYVFVSGTVLKLGEPYSVISRVSFQPSGSLVAIEEDTRLEIWDTKTRSLNFSYQPPTGQHSAEASAWSPDGTRLVLASAHINANSVVETTTLNILDLAGDLKTSFVIPDWPKRLYWIDPHHLLCIHANYATDTSRVYTWNLQEQRQQQILDLPSAYYGASAFHEQQALVALGTHDGTIEVWDVATNTRAVQYQVPHDASVLAFSPDAVYLAIGSNYGDLTLLNIHTGETKYLEGHLDTIHDLVFDSDGSSLFSVSGSFESIKYHSEETTLRQWDTATGTGYIIMDTQGRATAIDISADDTQLAVGIYEGGVRLVEID